MNELYHNWINKGGQRADHKYTRREWKNGHWVYYYNDGVSTVDHEKGQNYKTVDQVKAQKDAEKAAVTKRQAEIKARQDKIEKTNSAFNDVVKRGESAIKPLQDLMDMSLIDIFHRLKKKQ